MRTKMKILYLVLILLTGTGFSLLAQKKDKRSKKSKQEEKNAKFVQVQKLIKSRNFIFDAERALPSGGQPVELVANPGQIIVQKDMAYAGLPYIGQSYTSMYGSQHVGMDFKGKMEDVKFKVNEKKRKIYFSFKVTDNDVYMVTMEITYNGGCSVTIISQRKSSISYSGKVSVYEGS